MNLIKKLTFTPFLVISMVAVVVFTNILLQDPVNNMLGLQVSSFFTLLYLSIALVAAGLFFALIVTLCLSWEIPLFVAGVSSLIPLMMIQNSPVNFVLAGGFFLSFILALFTLLQKLKNYLTFQPGTILRPGVGQLAFFMAVVISIASYQVVSENITKNGFSLPDQLIDAAVKMSGVPTLSNPTIPGLDNLESVKGVSTTSDTPAIQISPEQIEFIKQNPQLLEQFHITPEQFNAIVSPQQTSSAPSTKTSTSSSAVKKQPTGSKTTTSTKSGTTNTPSTPTSIGESDAIKSLIKSQLNTAIKPYAFFLAPVVGFLVFSSITFGNYVLGYLVPLVLWIIFGILEKSGFVHFEKEMREVKKLVV